MEHKHTIKENGQKKNAAPCGAASYLGSRPGGGRYKCFRAAFPHDYHFALGDCEIDDTYPEVSKS